MKRANRPPRVVLDTNVVLSALVFAKGRAASLRTAWQEQRLVPLVSKPTADELMRVLHYPKFRLTEEDRRELLADYLPWCEVVSIPVPPPSTPACRDAFDVPFPELALAAKADCLVAGDVELLSLAAHFACPVLTIEVFLAGLPA